MKNYTNEMTEVISLEEVVKLKKSLSYLNAYMSLSVSPHSATEDTKSLIMGTTLYLVKKVAPTISKLAKVEMAQEDYDAVKLEELETSEDESKEDVKDAISKLLKHLVDSIGD